MRTVDPSSSFADAVPPVLAELWRRRLDTMIGGIANGDSYYQQLANAAEHISSEYQGRFLIELIQNANDQAVRAGIGPSDVTVVRTKELICVGNSGQPFDAGRVDAVTSIFNSDKSAEECIGNKGIGFKAVFQIADSAEVYSAAPGRSLGEGAELAFKMVRKPLEAKQVREALRRLAAELLERFSERRQLIAERFPAVSLTDAILQEIGRAAWFTFPIPATNDDLAARVSELQIDANTLARTQTLIVLPLHPTQRVAACVDAAIDELCGACSSVGEHPPGATCLFLPGISRVTLFDRARDRLTSVSKTVTAPQEDLGGGTWLRRIRTTLLQRSLNDGAKTKELGLDWWLVGRLIGDTSIINTTAGRSERDLLQSAIASLRLPEANWKYVQHVPVDVALPDPRPRNIELATPLGANGRFCIGLPTHVATGAPFWASSHFHGKMDRTAIDFSNAYNGLIFDEVVRLCGLLIDRLKVEPDLGSKRLVTLSMERSPGALADALHAPGGLASGEIVVDGTGGFIPADRLRLPDADDLAIFNVLTDTLPDITAYGFLVPDRQLLINARKVLDQLPGTMVADDTCYLIRSGAGTSLLEAAASSHRAIGAAFWEQFLTWILDRFDVNAVEDQKLLPVGLDGLAAPSSRVFFPPLGGVPSLSDNEQTEEDSDELSVIDSSVMPLLRLFDPTAIEIRERGSKGYLPLAARLAPIAGVSLVKRPRQVDLITDALIPALSDSSKSDQHLLMLLHQALTWLAAMPEKSRKRVDTEALLVPAQGQGDRWIWVKPETVYLGMGWTEDPIVQLLQQAYGNRDNAMLVSWESFEERIASLPCTSDRQWWCDNLLSIGVWDCPRLVRYGKRLSVGQSNSYKQLSELSTACPVPCPDATWKRYVVRICRRPAATKSGQTFYVDDVIWIDGLENPDMQATVFESVLKRARRYESVMTNRLSRYSGEDSTSVDSLWVHALRTESWKVIPTSSGPTASTESWFISPELKATKGDRFSLLPCVRPEFHQARALLQTIGVATIEEAPIARLVSALHHLSRSLPNVAPETAPHYEAITGDLYEAIERRLGNGESADALRTLVKHHIPLLWRGRVAPFSFHEHASVVVDDDPVRRRHIASIEDAWTIPQRFHQSFDRLVPALRAIVGNEKVVRVSECGLQIEFESQVAPVPLLEHLRRDSATRDLAVDIALLLVKGGSRASSPYEPEFEYCWNRIRQTAVVRGRFAGPASLQACFDAYSDAGPMLMVDSRLRVHAIVTELWQTVDLAYRDIWAAFGTAIEKGMVDTFFSERGVSLSERAEVESIIGLAFEQRLRSYQPVCLAAWKDLNHQRHIDDFFHQWPLNCGAAEAAIEWLKWASVEADIEFARAKEEPHGSLFLLSARGLSIEQWQTARRELGEQAWVFASSVETFNAAVATVASRIAALFAFLVVPRASGSSSTTVSHEIRNIVREWIMRLRGSEAPSSIAHAIPTTKEIISATAALAHSLVGPLQPAAESMTAFLEPLEAMKRCAPAEVAQIKLKDEPGKAAAVYERNDLATREADAHEAIETILRVAAPLAGKFGESIDQAAVKSHHLVLLLGSGEWANRVSVLAAVRFAIEALAPKTAVRMKERQAFRDLADWRVLWRKFDELGELPEPAITPPPKQRFRLLDSEWTSDEFRSSAAAGDAGRVCQTISGLADASLNLEKLRAASRAHVNVRVGKTKGTGGNGGVRMRISDEQLNALGAIGEFFVYAQFQQSLPEFDLTNWRSGMRSVFGFGDGNDSLGYDFEYNDTASALTGLPNRPRCLIEVKSEAGDCSSSFEMSTNEWAVAQQCHDRVIDAVYVIVRVACTASHAAISDLLINPVDLHLRGLLDYSSRNLLVHVGSRIE